ncbi:LysR substrate-binding domain-containing protein [Rhodococcus sp. SGAir0479]|uniref:LysR substrate-binding domain-containing protein n=1 Tax=Rhodococcus sp. SGAir0479 TaxID=2567884 RepID=UPI0034A0B38D
MVIPAPGDLPSIPLGEKNIRMKVATGHQLAMRTRIALSEVADEPSIANPTSYHLRQLTESWCAKAGFAPRAVFENTEFETLRFARPARAGGGAAARLRDFVTARAARRVTETSPDT